MNALERTGFVDAPDRLRLDEPLPLPEQSRVRVIVLVPEAQEISEEAWAKAVSSSSAFEFLNEPREDIYSASDGRPFHGQG